MIKVEGGTFIMGAHHNQLETAKYDEKPAHNVTVKTFMIAETEVTQRLWNTLMRKNPSENKGNDNPVESVTIKEIMNFISVLNEVTGLKFRLPTEAEWEYAARGGNKSKGYKYSGSNDLKEISSAGSVYSTVPVKSKKPNEIGIYDMTGNVWECVSTAYGQYPESQEINPSKANSSDYFIIRGGSYETNGIMGKEDFSSTSRRQRWLTTYRTGDVGFRLVL